MQHYYYVYILASKRNGILYVGMTNEIVRRVQEHKDGLVKGFTRRYGVKNLVYACPYEHANDAIAFEKRLKRWRRAWKIELIEKENPDWRDLHNT